MARVLIAPDAFKGTMAADRAADAMARGWLSVRPDDAVTCLPQADGGEGTLDAVFAAGGTRRRTVQVDLPAGPHPATWLRTDDGTAVVELAECCGLPLVGTAAPLQASTRPVGQVLRAALADGVQAIRLGLGGSASTDGGAGCLAALGLRVLDGAGRPVDDGGAALASAASLDASGLVPPPARGVELLCDVTAPLFGPAGAAAIFGPQKGADPAQVRELDAALRHWHGLVGGAAEAPGAGAAGGIAYGLASLWGATLVSGAEAVAALTGLAEQVAASDVVITGEGSFDEQSLTGKVPGHVLAVADGRTRMVIAGRVAVAVPGVSSWSLTGLAGSPEAAMARPEDYLVRAGALAARSASSRCGRC